MLARLYRSGQITAVQYHAYGASFSAALRAERRLQGVRAFELTAVLLVIAVVGAVVLARRSGQRAQLDEHEQAIEEQITAAELSEAAEESEEEVVTP